MGDKTGISWTDATWNPIRGCTRVSEGCRHCYAERQALRITRFDRGLGKPEGQGAYDGLVREVGGEARWTGQVRLVPELLDQPLRWKRPRRIFVNSMSDLFHESMSEDAILAVFMTMARAPRHTFQVLTKRPARMLAVLSKWQADGLTLREGVTLREGSGAMLPNVWLGVSAEDQATFHARVPDLLRCPAAVRWLSIEPQLGPVDLRMGGMSIPDYAPHQPLPQLDWIVQGGESGPGARPFDLAWARSVRDQCKAAGVSYFCKQLGARPVVNMRPAESLTGDGRFAVAVDEVFAVRNGNAYTDPSGWPEDLRVREYPR